MTSMDILRDRVGDRLVVDAREVQRRSMDNSLHIPDEIPARALLLATSTEDVAAGLRWANDAGVPVSVWGAGTGSVGGAAAYGGGLVISLERMNRVLDLDVENRLAVVEPGVITAELDDLARAHGLFYPPDPASSRLSTIGGNIATNAGGLRCVAYGVTGDWIAGLEVVLPDGRVLRTGSRTRKNVVGYDLTRLFVGSEGTLGIVTRATVRLRPVPAGVPTTFRVSFADLESAGRAVTAVVNGHAAPETMELMDALTVECIERFRPSGVTMPDGGALLVGQTVGADSRDTAEAIATSCRELGGFDVRVSDAEPMLEARRLVGPALDAAGIRVSTDVGVPIAALAEMFRGIARIAQVHGRRIATAAHAGDGNLHATVEADETVEDYEAAQLAMHDIVAIALSLDGTITGEHGIGSVRVDELPWQLDTTALDVQRTIKRALDPRGILSPGRAI